jgi:hypothetical protein
MSKNMNCLKCMKHFAGKQEWFEFTFNSGRVMAWDVTRAMAMVVDRVTAWNKAVMAGEVDALSQPELGMISPDVGRIINEKNGFDPEHVEHVNHEQFGLSVDVEHEGEKFTILIDGNHRLAKAVALGEDFVTVILTEDEDAACRMSEAEIDIKNRACLLEDFLQGLREVRND